MKYALSALGLIAGLFIFFYGGYLIGSQDIDPYPVYVPTPKREYINDRVLFTLIQKWREYNNLNPYIENPALCNFALIRAYQVKEDWSHDKFLENTNLFGFTLMGENLAKDFYTEQEYLDGWLSSPGHRATLEHNFTHSCLRCVDGYCAQEFGM